MNWTNDDGSTSVGIWEDFKFKPKELKTEEEKPVETVEKPVETKKKTKKK